MDSSHLSVNQKPVKQDKMSMRILWAIARPVWGSPRPRWGWRSSRTWSRRPKHWGGKAGFASWPEKGNVRGFRSSSPRVSYSQLFIDLQSNYWDKV